VVAIEVDQVLVQYLRARFREEPKLAIVEGDVLKVDLTQWGPVSVAGNLPYYITSPIVEKVLGIGTSLRSAVFLVQKEVAERLTAAPGVRDYGFLTVATQFFAEVELLFDVPPSAFRPPPKVDSAVVRLKPRKQLPAPDAKEFLRFASLCFHQKRKTLRNNLLGVYDKARLDAIPETAQRAEQMPIAALIELQRKLAG
jgi:16S rRNA (adenine1518-N6/adenine1519-N6)-dimethyltransferase